MIKQRNYSVLSLLKKHLKVLVKKKEKKGTESLCMCTLVIFILSTWQITKLWDRNTNGELCVKLLPTLNVEIFPLAKEIYISGTADELLKFFKYGFSPRCSDVFLPGVFPMGRFHSEISVCKKFIISAGYRNTRINNGVI